MKKLDLRGWTTEALFEQFEAIRLEGGVNLVRQCAYLVEIHRRGATHPCLGKGVYRWYQEIHKGKLSPELAFLFSGSEKKIAGFIGMPVEEQAALARGTQRVPVAHANNDGEIVLVERKISELSVQNVSRVVSEGKIVPFKEQKKVVAKELKAAPVVRTPTDVIGVDKGTRELFNLQPRMKAADLVAPMRLLGYEFSKIVDRR